MYNHVFTTPMLNAMENDDKKNTSKEAKKPEKHIKMMDFFEKRIPCRRARFSIVSAGIISNNNSTNNWKDNEKKIGRT
jgi:hypothetical protein